MKWTRRQFLQRAGGTLFGGWVTYRGHWVEPYQLRVERHTVLLPYLPAALDGMTVTQISDLHRGFFTTDDVIRPAIVAAVQTKPDLILLTGDFIQGNLSDAEPVCDLLQPLRQIAPMGLWGCLGNHDYHNPKHLQVLLRNRLGVTLLRNENREIAPGLWLAGVEDWMRGHPNTGQALTGLPPQNEATLLFMAHNPLGVRALSRTGRQAVALAGHTHGGQVCVPGSPRWNNLPAITGYPLVSGWGKWGETAVYVTRGVGMTGVALRLFCPPEITHFTLRRAKKEPGVRVLKNGQH